MKLYVLVDHLDHEGKLREPGDYYEDDSTANIQARLKLNLVVEATDKLIKANAKRKKSQEQIDAEEAAAKLVEEAKTRLAAEDAAADAAAAPAATEEAATQADLLNG